MLTIESASVIGFGEFGKVAASQLVPPGIEILVHDKNPDIEPPENVRRVDLVRAASADVIFLAVPYDSYPSVLPDLQAHAHPGSLIIDVCSVKIKPTLSFWKRGLLGRPNVLMTHPLFGPQSLTNGVEGKNLAVTRQNGDLADQLLEIWRTKGVNLSNWTTVQHDREMAKVHVLTFFVGKTLLEMGIEPSPLNTPYYSELLDLVDLERHHSPELFDTIQRHNPFARRMREEFLATAYKLHAQFD